MRLKGGYTRRNNPDTLRTSILRISHYRFEAPEGAKERKERSCGKRGKKERAGGRSQRMKTGGVPNAEQNKRQERKVKARTFCLSIAVFLQFFFRHLLLLALAMSFVLGSCVPPLLRFPGAELKNVT